MTRTRFVSEVPADADRPVETPPVIDGVQLTGGQDDPMVGVDAATSETLWTQPGHLVYDDVWAVGDGAVFAMETFLGDGSPKPPALVGYEVATGDVRWRREHDIHGARTVARVGRTTAGDVVQPAGAGHR